VTLDESRPGAGTIEPGGESGGTPPAAASAALTAIALRTMVVHTVTYFIAGLLAFTLLDYSARFTEPPLSYLMRQTDDPVVAAAVLFQPLRGLLFGLVFYLLRGCIFGRRGGWAVAWAMLVIVGIFSTFGPAPGSLEGLVFTLIPVSQQVFGLIEVIMQALLLSVVTVYWVEHRSNRWLNVVMAVAFVIVLLIPALGLLYLSSSAP
jgi:hypothetical protein